MQVQQEFKTKAVNNCINCTAYIVLMCH